MDAARRGDFASEQEMDEFIACTISGIVIPGRERSERAGIHNHDRKYGFRACAKWRIHDVQLHIGG
jgi:hypothetical protein